MQTLGFWTMWVGNTYTVNDPLFINNGSIYNIFKVTEKTVDLTNNFN